MLKVLLSVPHRCQGQRADCLPACVTMVLDHLDCPIPYSRLLPLLGTRDFGTPAENILRLEDLGIGVEVTLAHTDVEGLCGHLEAGRPVIAFVNTADLPYWSEVTDHTLVVVGVEDDVFYVNDPYFDQAPQYVSRTHFELAWLRFDNLCAVITISDLPAAPRQQRALLTPK